MRWPRRIRRACALGGACCALSLSACADDASGPAHDAELEPRADAGEDAQAGSGDDAGDGSDGLDRDVDATGDTDAQADAGSYDAARPDVVYPPLCDGETPRFATRVEDYSFGPGQNFGQAQFPDSVLGPPQGAGCCNGSLDTVSLGNGGFVTLEFEGNAIVDGEGPDFIVFENAFAPATDPSSTFAELATVAVSDDRNNWFEFPCTAVMAPYASCSGYSPVFANPYTNIIDPTDPSTAGGEAFDLADLGVERARYVRITDRADLAGFSGVFDLDAVAIVNAFCP